MTIWKFPIEIEDVQVIKTPIHSAIIAAQFQRGELCLWVEVQEGAVETEEHTIEIHGTGNPMPTGVKRRYIATVQMLGVGLVWHIYERI